MSSKNEIKNIIENLAADRKYSVINSSRLNALFESYADSAPDFSVNELALQKLKKEALLVKSVEIVRVKRIKIAAAFISSAAAAAAIVLLLNLVIPEKPQSGASVALFTGKVSILRNLTSLDMKTGLPLLENDIVVTDSNSTLDIDAGEIRVRINEKSIVSLNKMLPAKNKNEFSSFLKSGSLIMIVNRLRPNDSVSVKTNTSVAAVRGTVFGVKVSENGTAKYEVFEGKVKVRNSVPENLTDEFVADKLDEFFEKNSVIIGQNESCKVETNEKFLSSLNRENFKETINKMDLPEPVASDIEPLDLSSSAAGFIRSSKVTDIVQLRIKTIPESAEIKIDGSSKGIGTSFVILKKGLHDISISADGYKPQIQSRQFLNQENEIIISLEKINPVSSDKQLSSLSSDYVLSDNAKKIIITVSREGIIHAALNNKIIWTLSLKNRVSAQPVILNGLVYIPSYDEIISAVDISNGAIVWKRIYNGRVMESPGIVLNNGLLSFATSKNTLLRIDAGGNITGEFKFSEPVISFFYGDDQFVFAAFASGIVYGIDSRRNLKVIKTYIKEKIINMNLMNDVLLLVSASGNITAYNFRKDEIAWYYSTGDVFNSGAVFDDKFIYIPGLSGNIYKIDYDGTLIWKSYTGSRSAIKPVLDSGKLYIAGIKTISTIDTKSGDVDWSLVITDVVSRNIAVSDNKIHLVTDKKGLISLKK